MPWFKVDDQFWSHPKVVEMSADAVALWVRAGSYAAQHLTDGCITVGALRMLGGLRETADELVLGGLWEQLDNRTWRFKDWFDYQPSAEETAERRQKRSAAGRKGAEARWHGKSHGNGDGKSHGGSDADGVRGLWQTDAPSPSRTRDSSKTSQSQSLPKRASVSTDAMQIPEMTRRLAAQKGIQSLRTVADAIHRHTGIRVDANGALQVALSLLDRAKEFPSAPSRYVSSAIKQSPLEVQQFIHDNALEVA